MNNLFTPWRLKWYPIAVFIGLAIAFMICIFSGTGAKILSGRLGGDFPAFYGAGRIVLSGDIDQLYSIDRQIREQHLIDPDETGVLPFPYPPFVAVAYAPVSFFSYRTAYTIHTMINLVALIIAVGALRNVNSHIRLYFLPVFTLCLLFYPVLKAVLNGQNTALTLMLIALLWKFTSEDHPVVAGIFLGFLFYKPQFAVPLLGLYLLSGRFKTVAGSLGVLCMLIALNYVVYGSQWLTDWIHFAGWFSPADAINNKHNAISWAGFLTAIFGPENIIASYAGWVLILLTVLFISMVWFLGKKQSDLNAQMGLASVCLILMPPHVMYYDLGLIIFAYATVIEKISERKLMLVFIVWMCSFAQVFAKDLGFSPLFFVAVFTFILSVCTLGLPAIKPKPVDHSIM